MSITINSNLAATKSSLNLKRASVRLSKSLQRLSSGNRIVNASDDAGGLAVAMKLQSSLKRATASMQNTQNGKSFLQMQDSVLTIAGEIVDRMSELKSFWNDISKNDLDRETYNHEFHELQKELQSLKAQKFNGVSLFASVTPDDKNLKIITSDDGLGEHIEINRTGLFENFKSKYGADGVLNTGSHGEYRQLVGDFVADGGTLDANPGFATRDYQAGEVVFKRYTNGNDSGYFMALKDVVSGAKIEDTQDALSNWIRIADVNGKGFSEAYPSAPEYDHNNLKFNGKGDAMSYLKGDILKVQAHWNDPNSFVFIRALADIPRGITLNKILLEGIGDGKYFEFVGANSQMDGDLSTNKPTTSYVRPNKAHETPDDMENGSTANLRSIISINAGNSFTPTFVENSAGEIFTPTTNWGIKEWNNGIFKYGDVVYNKTAADDSTSYLKEISSDVLGIYLGAEVSLGKFVQSEGKWYKAVAANGVPAGEKPTQIDSSIALHDANSDYTTNALVKSADNLLFKAKKDIPAFTDTGVNPVLTFDSAQLNAGDVVKIGDDYFAMPAVTVIEDGETLAGLGDNEFFFDNRNGQVKYRKMDGTGTGTAIDASIGDLQTITAGNQITDLSLSNTDLWEQQAMNWQYIEDPMSDSVVGFATNVTDKYANLEPSPEEDNLWTKTHFGALVGKTIGTDYTRGDNIYYQGKHYLYVSHLPSSDPVFTAGSGQAGVTGFEQLLMQGAVVELSLHVDTIGGGGAPNLADGAYYRPNQDLDFIDRLPDTGIVRANSIERRTDPTINADGIFNTSDDLFYGGLNPGGDGIFGTMDDYYTTTAYSQMAKLGGHVDADADNNKDLLDTSNSLADFSVADFVDYIQTIANFRASNGGTMSRLDYASRMLEENQINLEAAHSRIMDADIATEAARMAQQNVLMQAGAAMVAQANQMNQIVLQLLQ